MAEKIKKQLIKKNIDVEDMGKEILIKLDKIIGILEEIRDEKKNK